MFCLVLCSVHLQDCQESACSFVRTKRLRFISADAKSQVAICKSEAWNLEGVNRKVQDRNVEPATWHIRIQLRCSFTMQAPSSRYQVASPTFQTSSPMFRVSSPKAPVPSRPRQGVRWIMDLGPSHVQLEVVSMPKHTCTCVTGERHAIGDQPRCEA